MVAIVELKEYRPDYAEAVQRLTDQLTPHPVTVDETVWQQMLSRSGSHIFLLLADGMPAGMISVGTYFTPTGGKAWIEDVVVDQAYRGRGFGKLLVGHAIGFARVSGASVLMLTSRPARIAANRLYSQMGFERRETNVYKMEL